MRRWYLTLTLTLIALGVAALPCLRAERSGCRMSRMVAEAEFPDYTAQRVRDALAMGARGPVALLVIDTSGSVPQSPDRAVEAFHALQSRGVQVGAVTYSDQVRFMLGAQTDSASVLDIIGSLPTRGGSNPIAGLTQALDWYRDFGLTGRLVWVSDGSMNSGQPDPAALYALGDRAAAMGVVIDAVEVGTPDSTAMRDLARMTGGTWVQAGQAVAGRL